MEKPRPIESSHELELSTDPTVKSGQLEMRARIDKILRVGGKGVEILTDTVNFGVKTIGYSTGAAARAVLYDLPISVYRGVKKQSFDQAA